MRVGWASGVRSSSSWSRPAAVLGSPLSCAADPAQKIMRVGFVSPNAPSTDPRGPAAFWGRLRELGWVEGQNLVIEARWAEGQYDRLPALMGEVIERKVDVLVTYGTPAAIAAKKATSTIPIVVAVMGNPIGTGLVQGLARPGGNLTGTFVGVGGRYRGEVVGTPAGDGSAAYDHRCNHEPREPSRPEFITELKGVAPARRLKLRITEARNPEELARAFEQAGRQAQAVVVIPDPVFLAHRQRITALAARQRLPAMYGQREFVDADGLMAYGPDRTVMFRRAAEYVEKILKGTQPNDLPIEQPTQYVFVVNLKTAKALGITVPESILLRADEVIR